jgi:ABC-type multidrug transport system ATPase subunit
VRAVGLGKRLDGRPVVRGVDLRIDRGELVALLGDNGAGKTTLLRLCATLARPTEGLLELFGRSARRNTAALRARLGVVGHTPMLYRDLTARENLELFGGLYGVEHPRLRARELLERLRLGDRAEERVRTLSRGMVQRLAIARALVHTPALLLADEPFTGLDQESAEILEETLRELAGQPDARGVLFSTHDVPGALRLAGRVVVLHAGRVVLDAPAAGCDEPGLMAAMGGRA